MERESSFDLGHDHWARFTAWCPDRELNPQYTDLPDVDKWGLIIEHPDAQSPGERCVSALTFDGEVQRKLSHVSDRWQVHSLEPETLHVEPSVLCFCGDHGFIRNGRWEPC